MQLEGIVHKPPMISVNVTDKAFAWQVEACTSVSNRKVSSAASSRPMLTSVVLHMRIAERLQSPAHPEQSRISRPPRL